MKRGFLLGKFMPPHSGHEFMSRAAALLCDELTILVCSLPEDPIPGYKRHEWMKALFPGSRVLHHDRPVPQEPSQHPDFWRIWQGICKSAHPEPIDCVFGSENYVVRLAAELGAEPAIIDRERIGFPVSGTAVRTHPYRHWPMIPGPVRSWYQRRVVMFGAESTGKSSVGAALARAFETVLVPEYGRAHDEARHGEPWTSRDFDLIRERQTAMRKAAAWNAGPILMEDTDAYLTDVWQSMLTGAPLTVSESIEPADLYLFLGPDLPWENDGTRYWGDPQVRSDFDHLCSKVLTTIGAKQARISGSWDQRLASCRASISSNFPEALMDAPR